MSGIIGRTCPECGDHFTTNRIDRHYCSDDCRNGNTELVSIDRVVWETVTCPWCFAVEGLACEDEDGYRQPDKSHSARIEAFHDFTEYRGQ